jgi:hypothetical protein
MGCTECQQSGKGISQLWCFRKQGDEIENIKSGHSLLATVLTTTFEPCPVHTEVKAYHLTLFTAEVTSHETVNLMLRGKK